MLTVTTKDEFGNIQLDEMSSPPSLSASNQGNIIQGAFTYSFTYVGNGQYTALFQFIIARVFQVKVLIGQKQIMRSPFTCLVMPSFAVGATSYNSSAIPYFVEAGQRAQFTIQVG